MYYIHLSRAPEQMWMIFGATKVPSNIAVKVCLRLLLNKKLIQTSWALKASSLETYRKLLQWMLEIRLKTFLGRIQISMFLFDASPSSSTRPTSRPWAIWMHCRPYGGWTTWRSRPLATRSLSSGSGGRTSSFDSPTLASRRSMASRWVEFTVKPVIFPFFSCLNRTTLASWKSSHYSLWWFSRLKWDLSDIIKFSCALNGTSKYNMTSTKIWDLFRFWIGLQIWSFTWNRRFSDDIRLAMGFRLRLKSCAWRGP